MVRCLVVCRGMTSVMFVFSIDSIDSLCAVVSS